MKYKDPQHRIKEIGLMLQEHQAAVLDPRLTLSEIRYRKRGIDRLWKEKQNLSNKLTEIRFSGALS